VKFHPTPLAGAYRIEPERIEDERGFFAALLSEEEYAARGLKTRFVRVSSSLSTRRGTLRGMHYQLPAAAEAKLVRCIRGALWDVILDLRSDSPTFGRWSGAELSAENRAMVYVPEGVAHGFITLVDETEVIYLSTAPYAPRLERGVRWDDPKFAIRWPIEPTVMSEKDRSHPDFDGPIGPAPRGM